MFLLRYPSVSGWGRKHECLGAGNSGGVIIFFLLWVFNSRTDVWVFLSSLWVHHLSTLESLTSKTPPITPGAVGTEWYHQYWVTKTPPAIFGGIAWINRHKAIHFLQDQDPKAFISAIPSWQTAPARAELGSAPTATLRLSWAEIPRSASHLPTHVKWRHQPASSFSLKCCY